MKKRSLAHNNATTSPVKKNKILKEIRNNYQLFLLILPPLAYIIIFKYIPMYGVQLAFKDFVATKGIFGSPWVGLKHFDRFVNSYFFPRVMKNTIGVSLYGLIAGFPFPILLALALNSTRNKLYRKTVQMSTYLPHFISTVTMVGMVMQFLNPRFGMLAEVAKFFGKEPLNYIGIPKYFKSIYVWSNIWQDTGWGTIIYLAALSAIDPSLQEAAIVDGAGRFKRIIHIDIPGILPTIVIMLILRSGRIMNVGFENIFLLQNQLNLPASEVISTYVYKVGLGGDKGMIPNFPFATAVDLFNSVINISLLLSMNWISKRLTDSSLW